MVDQIMRVRIFVGGPSDVSEERNATIDLIRNELHEEYPDLRLDPFTWDDPRQPLAFKLDSEPQEIVYERAPPGAFDVVIMIFKWRFGSRTIIGGKEYPSASAYELDHALESAKRPIIGVFRYTNPYGDPVPQGRSEEDYRRSKDEIEKAKEQYRLLDEYFDRLDTQYNIRRQTNYYRDRLFVVGQVRDFLRRELKALLSSRHHARPDPTPDLQARKFDGYPFRGLFDFGYVHRDLFFGRSAEIETLARHLQGESSPRLLIIHGDSGVGKSSLLKAGLLPRLIEKGASKDWREITFDPKKDPFLALASSLKHFDNQNHGLIPEDQEELSHHLFKLCAETSAADSVRPKIEAKTSGVVLAGLPDHAQLVIAINQLEELLTVADELRSAFLRFIALMVEASRIRIFCTLRSDVLPEFYRFDSFGKVLQSLHHFQYLLRAPDRVQLEEMILGPAKAGNVTLERGLVAQILDDAMATKEGALPLVAYTLQTLRLEHGDKLTLEHYRDLKGLTGAVKKLAAKVSSKTSDEALEALFDHLALLRNGVLSRRYPLRSELEAHRIPRELIDGLNRERLLQTTLVDNQPAVRLAHEVLFQAWPDLQAWAHRSEAKLKLRDEIERDAAAWIESGRRLRFVKLRSERLDEIRTIAAGDPNFIGGDVPIEEYVEAAEAQRQREMLIASINGGHLSGIVQAMKSGGRLEIEDRYDGPGGVRPQFWAAVTGDDRTDPGADLISTGDSPRVDRADSIFADGKLIDSSVARGFNVPFLVSVSGHLDLLKRLAAQNPDAVRRISEAGSNILTAAALGGHLDIVKYLVEELHFDPTARDTCEVSPPILWAHQQNHHDIVAYLLGHGASLDFSVDGGWNKLTEAARSGDVDIVRELLDQGLSPNYRTESGATPLTVASQEGHMAVVELLFAYGAARDQQTEQGVSALHCSVFQDDPALFDLLISHGCSINIRDAEGWTPLHYAVGHGKTSHAERLVRLGADFTIATRQGCYPMTLAARNGYEPIIRALLAGGDDVNRAETNQWRPLHFTCDDGDVATTQTLLGHAEIELDARDQAGRTPLMMAALKGHAEVVHLLVAAGANRRLVNRAGTDALALAIESGNLAVIRELLAGELALDRNYRNISTAMALDSFGRTTSVSALSHYPNPDHLALAVAQGDVKIVRCLLDAGVDRLERDNLGDIGLHHAARFGDDELVTLLLQGHETAISVRDREGRTPLDVAQENGNFTTVQRFVAAGAAEPREWRRPRISDEAQFLTFGAVPEQFRPWLRTLLTAQNSFVIRPERMLLRAAPLLFYENGYLIAAEDPDLRGPREQFALVRPGDDFVMLDWKNEPIYTVNERWGLRLEHDDALKQYCRFFFHFVRGQLGQFTFVEDESQIPWSAEASEADRQRVRGKLAPLEIRPRTAEDHVRLTATVIFKNALFQTDVIIATRPTEIKDDATDVMEVFTLGQMKLTDEDLLVEELSVEIARPPGVFG